MPPISEPKALRQPLAKAMRNYESRDAAVDALVSRVDEVFDLALPKRLSGSHQVNHLLTATPVRIHGLR